MSMNCLNCLWLIWPIHPGLPWHPMASLTKSHQRSDEGTLRRPGQSANHPAIMLQLCCTWWVHWCFLHLSTWFNSHQCFPHTSSHIIATPRKWTQKHSKELPWSALKLAWHGVVSPTTHHHGVLLSCKDTSGKRTTRIWRTTLCLTTWKDCWRQKQELTKGPMETEEHIFFCWHPILCDGDDQNQPQNWAGVILNFEACALWLEEPHSADMPQPPPIFNSTFFEIGKWWFNVLPRDCKAVMTKAAT